MRKILLFWGDALVLYVALFLTLLIRYGAGETFFNNSQIHFWPFTLIFAFWLLVFYVSNLYEISYAKNSLQFYGTFFYSTLVNILISIALLYFAPIFKITPRTNLFIFLSFELLLALGWRYFFNRAIARGASNSTLIVGVSPQSQELYDFLLANPQLGYKALGIIDVDHYKAPAVLEELIRQQNIRTLILTPTAYAIPKIIDILYQLLALKMTFFNLSDFYEQVSGKVPVDTINQAWFLENLSEGSKRGYEIIKRVFDLAGVLLLGLTTLPLQGLVAIMVRLGSVGPVIYRQKRVGRTGKTFILYKYRTMFTDAESQSGPVWAVENDARTTPVGRVIRRTRLDELPQLWNILKGEMSFIGPRPERPEFHDKLKAQIPFYEERYLIRPGLTGWAQIKYKLDFRGRMTAQDTFEKLQYDLFYIKNRSWLLDGAIVLKTVRLIVAKLFQFSARLTTSDQANEQTLGPR